MASKKFKPYTLNIDDLGIEVPKRARKAALEEVADYLHEEILSHIGEGKSPVSGGKWRTKLTEAYEKEKEEESGVGFANLELTGELLDSLTVKAKGTKIILDVGEDQYGKAEGHITGQYGKGKMKKDYRRQFLPQRNENLKRDILSNVKRILREYEDGEN